MGWTNSFSAFKAVTVAIFVVSYLILSTFTPVSAFILEDLTGTWVGSYDVNYGWTLALSKLTYAEDFTVYLTITANRTEFVGRATIIFHKVSMIDGNLNYSAGEHLEYSVSPMRFEVGIHGYIFADSVNKLSFSSDEKLMRHVTETYYKADPHSGEVHAYPSERDEPVEVPFFSVSIERVGNDTIRISENHPQTEGAGDYSHYATGTLTLQRAEVAVKATCIDVRGDVKILRDGLEEALLQGAEISSGNVINTGSDGKVALSLPDGSELKLFTGTSVKLEELLEANAIKLTLLLGKIWLHVKSIAEALRPRTKFEAYTPTCILGVRDTEFVTEVSADNSTTLIVLEGSVDFSDPQQVKNVTVGQNQISTCQPNDVPSDPSPLDPSQIQRWWEEATPAPTPSPIPGAAYPIEWIIAIVAAIVIVIVIVALILRRRK